MKKIAIINGPNLNMLGVREPHIYGHKSLEDIKNDTERLLLGKGVRLSWFQSNIEGEIVNFIQDIASNQWDALIINPGAYAHTSVAILDALKLVAFPVIEVHLTNVYQRETFRQTMLTASAASIIMSGLYDTVYYHAVLTQIPH